MATRRTKSPAKLKKEKEQRNFSVDEIKFVIANAPNMTVEEMSDHLNCSEGELNDLIAQYNKAGNDMVRGSYIVGKDERKGIIVATQASSETGDRNFNNGNIVPKKPIESFIHRIK